ncbi:MAG: pyruvate kinase, partial [Oscillospiraceae bacterium]|nr:pyruvate kinase [Oscillospiraceae bacterium]
MRKTKIICTIGPSIDDPEILRQLMREGMNVARLNFSHGDHAEQKQRADLIKK